MNVVTKRTISLIEHFYEEYVHKNAINSPEYNRGFLKAIELFGFSIVPNTGKKKGANVICRMNHGSELLPIYLKIVRQYFIDSMENAKSRIRGHEEGWGYKLSDADCHLTLEAIVNCQESLDCLEKFISEIEDNEQ